MLGTVGQLVTLTGPSSFLCFCCSPAGPQDSPINKLLYARDIPRYKRMVERYYADIRQTIPASDQEMNSILAELSRNYSGDLGARVALHELYKYINKYYDQIITALEEDGTAQKMQLGYRLQQIAAAVENKVTDL